MAPTPEIEAILRSNPRERLLVTPLKWTSRHLELLNIDFQELEAHEDSGNAEGKAKGKVGNEHKSNLHSWVDFEHLLAGADDSHIVKAYYQCPFRFGNRVFNLPSPIYTPRPSKPYRRKRNRHDTIPANLVLARSSDIKSPSPLPYIAAALIAAAQSQAGSRRTWGYRERHRYAVCALLADYPDSENITVYQACVSRTFLSKFGFPDFLHEVARTPPVTPESVIIQHKLIPYEPRLTLQDRLLGAAGDVNILTPDRLPAGFAVELGLTARPASG